MSLVQIGVQDKDALELGQQLSSRAFKVTLTDAVRVARSPDYAGTMPHPLLATPTTSTPGALMCCLSHWHSLCGLAAFGGGGLTGAPVMED